MSPHRILSFFKNRLAFYGVTGIVIVLIFIGYFLIIYNQNNKNVTTFNQQLSGLARASTTYLANNYDLYGSPYTIRFHVIVSNFLGDNSEISKFQILDTNGKLLFDSKQPTGQVSGSVSRHILDLSRNDAVTPIKSKGRISVVVSPYYEDWGSHQYSLLFFPSYAQVNKQNLEFSFELGIITILSAALIVTMAGLFIINERNKMHLEERARLEVLDRQRKEFMMLVAHNLRSPVTIIKGYLALLSEMEIPPKQQELVQTIEEASHTLYLLIEQILSITSVLGQPNQSIGKENINIDEILASIFEEYKTKIAGRHLTVTAEVSPKNLALSTNKRYLKLILMALIENAIKFNKDKGEIKVIGKVDGDNILISIADSGIGIAENEKSTIFMGFHKSDKHKYIYDYNYSGTGLGLYISKILSNALGGDIRFESSEDKGSVFYLYLPNLIPGQNS